jgi:stage IV sporulation protein B
MQTYLALPTEQKMSVGDNLSLGVHFPQTILNKISAEINSGQKLLNFTENSFNFAELTPIAQEPGKISLQLKLFGIIPLKNIDVDVVENIKLYPGGQSVGVILRTQGVLIVGQSPIVDENGEARFPSKDVGIRVGDTIVKINDTFIQTDDQLARLVNKLGSRNEIIKITIKRNDKIFTKEIKPIYCPETKTYRIGLYVRDNAGGVGTLTFFDPLTGKYGALGHMISDTQTNQQIYIKNGKIVRASIEDIKKGTRGKPGEKVGMFVDNSELGDIQLNSYCGIFGTISSDILTNSYYNQPLPIAYASQIKTGPAEILTVVENEKIEKFSISIVAVVTNRTDGRNLVIQITDPRLLEKTGGIIQGMSGSPIIQNGKLIGAVTHVFINDPTHGYGIFIENMLHEVGIGIDELGA